MTRIAIAAIAALLLITLVGYFVAESISTEDHILTFDRAEHREGLTQECQLAASLRKSIEANLQGAWGECRFHEDCTVTYGTCGLGCYKAVNNEYAHIFKETARSYASTVELSGCRKIKCKCNDATHAICDGGQCALPY